MKGRAKGRKNRRESRAPAGNIAPVQIPRGEVLHEVVTGDMVHKLLLISGRPVHQWTVLTPDGEIPISGVSGRELLESSMKQIALMKEGGEGPLRYQTFPGFDESDPVTMDSAEFMIGVVREGGGLRIRLSSEDDRYELIYPERPWRDPLPIYMISRLNSVGFKGCVKLLGMGYWSMESRELPWLSLVRYPAGTKSGFSPFLSELGELLLSSMEKDGEAMRRFILDLSLRKDLGSLNVSRRLGRALGSLHGSLLMERSGSGKVRMSGPSADILRNFERARMGMEDVGTHLGMLSGYLEQVKKGLFRKLGDSEPPYIPPAGRKQKVVKGSRLERYGELSGLSLLRSILVRRQKEIRERFSVLRRFKGSPLVPAGVDSRLDHVEFTGDGDPLFRAFDWSFFDPDEKGPARTLPLKDLSLISSSLDKARYLSARRLFTATAGEAVGRQLSLMFLDYNLAKGGHSAMMEDLNVVSRISRRDVPFRVIFLASVISSLWMDRNRNALVQGYNEALSFTENEDLLMYPKGCDTIEGLRIMRALTSFSNAARTISERNGKVSIVGLESDLLSALSV